MTHELNRDRHTIMNGYQCYLKRMAKVIPDEIELSKKMGFNLGIKLIRGAYMTEERELAAKAGKESPIWDTLEDTHKCYNTNV
jgi:proline dehydrogenase